MSTAGAEIDVGDGEAEEGDARAIGTADEVLEGVLEGVLLVVDEESVDVDDEVEEVGEADASDAEDRMLGQKVLLHVFTSGSEHC